MPEEHIAAVPFCIADSEECSIFMCSGIGTSFTWLDFITTDCNPGNFLLSSDIVSKKIESAFILHSESDDIVPFKDTQELFRNNRGLQVISCNDDHRMRKEETLNAIIDCVNSYSV